MKTYTVHNDGSWLLRRIARTIQTWDVLAMSESTDATGRTVRTWTYLGVDPVRRVYALTEQRCIVHDEELLSDDLVPDEDRMPIGEWAANQSPLAVLDQPPHHWGVSAIATRLRAAVQPAATYRIRTARTPRVREAAIA